MLISIDLELLVRFEQHEGRRVTRRELMDSAMEAFLAAGGLPALRPDPNRILDLYRSTPQAAVLFDVRFEYIVEMKRQIVAEREHQLWWSQTEVFTVAMHLFRSERRTDILRATWGLSNRATNHLVELGIRWDMSAGEVLERLVCTSPLIDV